MLQIQCVRFTFLLVDFGHFPFVRTDRPDHSRRNDNFPFNQISQILNGIHEGDEFLANTLGKSLFTFQTDWARLFKPGLR